MEKVRSILKMTLVSTLLILSSCENLNNQGNGSSPLGEVDSRSGYRAGAEQQIRNGRDPAAVLNDIAQGPTSNYCPTCDENHRDEPGLRAPAHVFSGNRPLQGRDLLAYLDQNYPKNCGFVFRPPYSSRSWSNSDTRGYTPQIGRVWRGETPTCHTSNCSTASYLALVEALRDGPHAHKFDERSLRMGGPLYQDFVWDVDLKKIFQTPQSQGGWGLGSYQRLSSKNEVKTFALNGGLEPGDFVVFNRCQNCGHSVVFSHMSGNDMCYWGSHGGTNGMGIECINVDRLVGMSVGRIDNSN